MEAATKREKRRRQIAISAGSLFAERGIHATTVREIGAHVGILSGSLYHHFDSKLDVVHEFMRAYCSDLVARYERAAKPGGTAVARLRRLFHACFEANIEHPDEEAVLIRELDNTFLQPEFAYVHETLNKIEETFVEVIEEGVSRGEIRADLDARFVYRMMMDVMGSVPRWFDPRTRDQTEIVEGWIDVFFKGIGGDR